MSVEAELKATIEYLKTAYDEESPRQKLGLAPEWQPEPIKQMTIPDLLTAIDELPDDVVSLRPIWSGNPYRHFDDFSTSDLKALAEGYRRLVDILMDDGRVCVWTDYKDAGDAWRVCETHNHDAAPGTTRCEQGRFIDRIQTERMESNRNYEGWDTSGRRMG